jgi:hypothetical protein
MSRPTLCVWVLEIAVLNAVRPTISHWEIWQAFNTRSEAVAERDKPWKGKIKISKKFQRSTQRIRKYVPGGPHV